MADSIKKNYIYSAGYQILNIIVPVFTIPYISRAFGADGLGVYSYTSSIAQYFVLFAMLGLNNYGTRSIALVREEKEKLNKTFSEIYAMQMIAGIFILGCYLLYVMFLANDDYTIYFGILSIQIASVLFDVNWYFFGREKFQLTVLRNTIVKFATLIAIFVLIRTKDDLSLYLLIHVLSIAISAIVLWPYILQEIRFVRVSIRDISRHIKPNFILFIPVIAVSVYKYMDKIMLGEFSITETGYYENVEKILSVALGLITAFGTVMLPRMSNLAAKKEFGKAREYISKSMEFVIFLSIALACGVFAIAPEFVPLFFGDGFEPCIIIMQTLAVTAIITSWANVLRTQYLIPFQKDNVYVYSVIAGAVTNFSLNLVFIKLYGAMGAVIGTIAAESVVAFIQTYSTKDMLCCSKMLKQTIPYFIFGIVMVIAVRMCATMKANVYIGIIIEVVVGFIVYTVLSLLYIKKSNSVGIHLLWHKNTKINH